MRRETQNILLLLLGGALLKLAVSGEYLNYVKPVHQPWVIGGGAIMVVLGIVAVIRDLRSGDEKVQTACDVDDRAPAVVGEHTEAGDLGEHDRPEHAEPAHAHSDAEPGEHSHEDGHSHSSRSSWLLLVPVLTVLLVAPPALGADSVTRAGANGTQAQSKASLNSFPPLPKGDVLPMRISDFQARAGWDSSGTLDGRTVKLTGFVAHNQGNVYVGRMVIGCCAADGYPVTVRLVGDGATEAAALKDDDWIEVKGQLVPGSASESSNYVPELTVESVHQVKQPADPYEY